MNKIVKINQAEAICIPLFDMNISHINQFVLEEKSMNEGSFQQNWDACEIVSNAKDFSLRWNGSLCFEEYDALRFFINYPKHLLLSGKAVVNGKEEILFNNIPGGSAPVEPTSKPLKYTDETAELTEFTLTFHCSLEYLHKHTVALYWVGMVATDREKLIEEQLPQYDEHSWYKFMNQDGKPGIRNNLFFTESELKEMKKRLDDPFLKPIAKKLKEEAAKWENFNPEKEIREYIPVEEHLYRYVRVRDRNRTPLDGPIVTLSIAGYLFDNPKWTKMAARMILSVIVTPKWFEGPQGCMEGSEWHHVCFSEDHYMSAIVTALGFMGNVFTDVGQEKVMAAIKRAWDWVNKTCEETGYRWYMNQGIVGNYGRMLGAYSLYKNGKDHEEYIERSYADHTKIVNHYLNEEGHCTEGSGYYQYSFSNSVLIWMVYANYKNIKLRNVVPERFIESIKYVECIMSSNEEVGYAIPINKSTYKPFNMVLLVFLASVCQWQDAYVYLKNRMEQGMNEKEMISGVDLLILLRFLPTELPKVKLHKTELILFKESGLFSYEFSNLYRGKFLFLCERNPQTGHYHEDRGSMLLEAYGKTLLVDLGTTNYSNVASASMLKAEYHNLAYPEGLPMKIANPKARKSASEAGVGCTTQIHPNDFTYPGPKLEYTMEIEKGVQFGADLRPLYNEKEVLLGRRDGRLTLNSFGGRLVIQDRWKLSKKRPLNITYISYAPWIIKNQEAQAVLEDINICISFSEKNGLPMTMVQEEGMIDSNVKKVYVLRVKTELASNIELRSEIEFTKGGEGK